MTSIERSTGGAVVTPEWFVAAPRMVEPTLARVAMVFDVGLDYFFGSRRRAG